MHILNGVDANGTWTLNVADDFYTNRSDALGGTLHNWGLSFE
jgi:subtilisin-like proprotein convertase family protein